MIAIHEEFTLCFGADGDSKQLQNMKLSTQLNSASLLKTSVPLIKIPEKMEIMVLAVQFKHCCICERYHSSCSKIEGKTLEDIHNFTFNNYMMLAYTITELYSKHFEKNK